MTFILFGPQKLFIFELVFNRLVHKFEVADLGHQLADNSHIRLIFFLALLLVMLEKVVIWLENWHKRDFNPAE